MKISKNQRRERSRKRERLRRIAHKNKLLSLIRKFDDDILRQSCEPVTQEDDLSFIKTMRQVLGTTKDGVGLAAPQIGVLKRVIALRPDRHSSEITILLNPEITDFIGEEVAAEEGCLSFPGVVAKTQRHSKIVTAYVGEDWIPGKQQFSGFNSVIFQHECDHLDGKCKIRDAYMEMEEANRKRLRIKAGVL